MAKYYKYFSTPEEHARAGMEALDKTVKEATKSKEAALAFSRRAGYFLPRPIGEFNLYLKKEYSV